MPGPFSGPGMTNYKEIKMSIINTQSTRAHWLLRIALASVFVYHGVLKLMNLEAFASMLPISFTSTVLVALAETGGGLLVLIGGLRNDRLFDIATRVGAALNIPVMIGAITLVHWGRWNFVPSETHPMGGIEFQVVLLLLMVYILVTGNKGTAPVGSASSPALSRDPDYGPVRVAGILSITMALVLGGFGLTQPVEAAEKSAPSMVWPA